MLIKLLCLFTIAITAVQGEISDSRIEADAARWTELHQKYNEHSPYGSFRGFRKTQCKIMFECCPDERDNFFDLMHHHTFEETCYGSRSSLSIGSRSAKCNGYIRQLEATKKSGDYVKLMKSLSGITGSDERFRRWRTQMASVCSADELEAYNCEPEEMTKFQSCQEKVLRLVASENNGRNYAAYVREWENHYSIYIRRLTAAFPYL